MVAAAQIRYFRPVGNDAMSDLIVGRQPVLEALKAGQPIEKILILHGTHGEALSAIYTLARKAGIPVTVSDKERFRTIIQDQSAQGVAAFAAVKAYAEVEDILAAAENKGEKPFLLVLDGIEDVHNLGALIRTADCAGVHGVIIPKHHAATVNATVMKTSAGAAAHMPIARVANIVQTLEVLKRLSIWTVGADMAATTTLFNADFQGAVAIVIGSEGKGIRRLVKETCDQLVKIPMSGKVGSLNASVSGALVMYEAVRQRLR